MSTPVEHTADDNNEAAPARHNTAGITTGAAARGPVHLSATHALKKAAERQLTTAPPAAQRNDASVAERAAAPATPQHVTALPARVPVVTADRQTLRSSSDETLPVAGGLALGLLAIGGIAFAAGRRKEGHADASVHDPAIVDATPVIQPEPVATIPAFAPREVAPSMIRPAAGAAEVPDGFDLSRFGRHTRAAYMGPTPDNPSHSLKRRLRRASFFDLREREAAAATGHEQEQVGARTAQAERDNGQITVRLAPQRQSSRFGYLLQR